MFPCFECWPCLKIQHLEGLGALWKGESHQACHNDIKIGMIPLFLQPMDMWLPLPWVSRSTVGGGGGEIRDVPLLHPSEDGKRRLWNEERGLGYPKHPQAPALTSSTRHRNKSFSSRGAADSGIFFGDGWIILGTRACVNTLEMLSECGEGEAGTVSHTPHTHALPNIPFSHPRTNPSPTGIAAITAPGSRSQILSLSRPRVRHFPLFLPNCWLRSLSSAGSSPSIHPSNSGHPRKCYRGIS